MGRIKDHPGRISQRLRNHWSFQASPEVTTHRAMSQEEWERDGGETPRDWARHTLHLPSQRREGERHSTWCFQTALGGITQVPNTHVNYLLQPTANAHLPPPSYPPDIPSQRTPLNNQMGDAANFILTSTWRAIDLNKAIFFLAFSFFFLKDSIDIFGVRSVYNRDPLLADAWPAGNDFEGEGIAAGCSE